MGQLDKALRLHLLDPDEALRTEVRSLCSLGVEVVVAELTGLTGRDVRVGDHDVVVVNVETPAGLELVASICARSDAPPVVAIGGKGFERKSLEHVLLLAEVRGAVATLPKPFEAPDLLMLAMQARKGRLHRECTSKSGGDFESDQALG